MKNGESLYLRIVQGVQSRGETQGTYLIVITLLGRQQARYSPLSGPALDGRVAHTLQSLWMALTHRRTPGYLLALS